MRVAFDQKGVVADLSGKDRQLCSADESGIVFGVGGRRSYFIALAYDDEDGDFDLTKSCFGETAAQCRSHCEHALDPTVTVRVAGMIDASGLGLMLALRKQAEAKGVGIKLMNVSKFVKQVFEITRLDTVFEVIPRVEPLPARSQARAARVEWAACA